MALGIAGSIVYCHLFLVRLDARWPDSFRRLCVTVSNSLRRAIGSTLGQLGWDTPGPPLSNGIYLFLAVGVLPYLIASLSGRWRLSDLGLRVPNRLAWRTIGLGFVLSLPFLWWMTGGERFAGPYLAELRRAGALAFCLYYLVNMLTEHFLIHGVVLGMCRRDGRWPVAPKVCEDGASGFRRVLRWLGLAQPTEGAAGTVGVMRWMGLPAGCVPALVTSTLLFALVHWGKDSRELLLSAPGGLALAYIAFRTNSWLTPFLLHLITAGAACLMIVW